MIAIVETKLGQKNNNNNILLLIFISFEKNKRQFLIHFMQGLASFTLFHTLKDNKYLNNVFPVVSEEY